MRIRFFTLLFFHWSLCGSVQAVPPDSLRWHLDELCTAYQEVYGFSGTVLVVMDEKPFFEKSYGLADRSFNIPLTPQTRNSINSISKTFTALAVLQQVEQGRLQPDQTIGSLLPELTAPWKDTVTIHHLLSHTSGLPRESGIQPWEEKTLAEQVKMVDQQQLLFRPGQQYGYSNGGMSLLGATLERVTGRSYATIIESDIIAPLELENTGVYQGRRPVDRQAVPYRLSGKGLEFTQRTKHLGENAGGGLYSTVGDLYRYVQALEKNQLLSEEMTRLLFEKHIGSGPDEYEGYAWSIKTVGERELRFAAGSGYGTKSVIVREPEAGLFIGITSNWGNTPILKLLGDLFQLAEQGEATLPTGRNLARPTEYAAFLGYYRFPPGDLKKHLGIARDRVRLQEYSGKVFLDDELLVVQGAGVLGLSYTDELSIILQADRMILRMNGIELIGSRTE